MGGVNHLYRHYDANGELLYVGISLNALNRLAQHREVSAWFPDIAKVTIESAPPQKTGGINDTTGKPIITRRKTHR